MNSSLKNKLLVWAVALLIVINVAVLVTIWYMHQHKDVLHKGTPADYLVEQLKLNDEQKNKLQLLAKQHHESAERIKEQIKNARDSFFNLIKQPGVSDSAKTRGANNIAKNLEQLEVLTFDHFQQVRSICDPQQQKKFDEILQEVLRMVSSGPPPGGPGGHPPPPGNDEHRPPPPGN